MIDGEAGSGLAASDLKQFTLMLKNIRPWASRIRVMGYLTLGMAFLSITLKAGQPAADVPSSPPGIDIPANATPELKEFLQIRAILAQKMEQINSRNQGSPSNLEDFQKQNAKLIKRQNELAQIITRQNARQPLPDPPPLQLPPNASPKLEAFLTARDQQVRDEIAFTNQHLNDTPAQRAAAEKKWLKQSADSRQHVAKLAQAVTAESNLTPQPMPPPLVIPDSASPKMRDFMALRDQLIREQIQVSNENLSSNAKTREASFEKWRQQNQGKFDQLNKMALNLSVHN